MDYDQFAPNFDVAYKTIQCVFVPTLELFGPKKTELWAKEVGKLSIILYGKIVCPPTWLPQCRCM